LNEILAAPDKGVPQDILSSAQCVAVLPSLIKGGFIFGARYGKGIATCRTTDDHWSAPAPVRITGGSWGLQIGAEAVDYVMLVMNQHGMDNLLASKFKIGADVSGAAGPVGRDASGSTDWKMRAEVLTYSRARGVFAGVTLNGSVIKQDTDDTLALYGKFVPFRTILTGSVPPPAGTQAFVQEVAKDFHVAQTQQNAKKAAPDTASSNAEADNSASSRGEAMSNSTSSGTQADSNTASATQPETHEATPAQVQANVQNALRNTQGLAAQDVNVHVAGNAVVLSGSVPTEKDKITTLHVTEQNSGGRIVEDDKLNVK
jgi:lipid-binding SYLF domain-containing protein